MVEALSSLRVDSMNSVKLNLGCGEDYREDYINVDSKRLKILLVTPSVYPYGIGGIESHVYHLVASLSLRGHTIEILTREGIVTAQGFNLSKISPFRRLYYIIRGEFDILHIHGLLPLSLFETGLLLLISRLRKKQ